MLWFARYNSEIDWETGKVKITRYTKEYRKQWRPKQEKTKCKKQKKKEKKK